ncbi:hypothetical protein C4J81_07625 [Deltaproteobacteria bacterium Smac51]|nr:hypothetical protein C4J81_07625 [Deltaproteobacteria bacterium Smac51]
MNLKLRVMSVIISALLVMVLTSPLTAANFLWQVTSKEGGQAYVLGSIHLAQEGLYPLRDRIMEAFHRSGRLVVELDVQAIDHEKMTRYVAKHGFSSDNRTLEERLSPETRSILKQSGFKTALLNPLKPWMAALALQLDVMHQYGYDEEYGLDRFFLTEAKARGLAIIELETLGEQMEPLVNMTEEESDLFFRATILELKNLPNIINAMFDAWVEGDADGFGDIFFQEYDAYPELVPVLDKVVFHRNDKMAARIKKLLSRPSREPYFIVIGAGHLVGPKNVLTRLKEKGCDVTQL